MTDMLKRAVANAMVPVEAKEEPATWEEMKELNMKLANGVLEFKKKLEIFTEGKLYELNPLFRESFEQSDKGEVFKGYVSALVSIAKSITARLEELKSLSGVVAGDEPEIEPMMKGTVKDNARLEEVGKAIIIFITKELDEDFAKRLTKEILEKTDGVKEDDLVRDEVASEDLKLDIKGDENVK